MATILPLSQVRFKDTVKVGRMGDLVAMTQGNPRAGAGGPPVAKLEFNIEHRMLRITLLQGKFPGNIPYLLVPVENIRSMAPQPEPQPLPDTVVPITPAEEPPPPTDDDAPPPEPGGDSEPPGAQVTQRVCGKAVGKYRKPCARKPNHSGSHSLKPGEGPAGLLK